MKLVSGERTVLCCAVFCVRVVMTSCVALKVWVYLVPGPDLRTVNAS